MESRSNSLLKLHKGIEDLNAVNPMDILYSSYLISQMTSFSLEHFLILTLWCHIVLAILCSIRFIESSFFLWSLTDRIHHGLVPYFLLFSMYTLSSNDFIQTHCFNIIYVMMNLNYIFDYDKSLEFQIQIQLLTWHLHYNFCLTGIWKLAWLKQNSLFLTFAPTITQVVPFSINFAIIQLLWPNNYEPFVIQFCLLSHTSNSSAGLIDAILKTYLESYQSSEQSKLRKRGLVMEKTQKSVESCKPIKFPLQEGVVNYIKCCWMVKIIIEKQTLKVIGDLYKKRLWNDGDKSMVGVDWRKNEMRMSIK